MSNALMESNLPAASKGKRWRCDVCNVREFSSFEEAVRHEEQCQKQKEEEKGEKKQTKVNSFFQQPAKKRKGGTNATATTASKPMNKKADTGTGLSESSSSSSSRRKRPPSRSKQPAVDLMDDDDEQDAPLKVSGKSRKAKKQKKDAPMASIFQIAAADSGADQKTIMAEQAAAEFRAKRLHKEQKRREQLQKRASAATTNTTTLSKPTTLATTQTATGTTTSVASPRSQKAAAPRFPVPSHVYPEQPMLQQQQFLPPKDDQSKTNNNLWLTQDHLVRARSALSRPTFPWKDDMDRDIAAVANEEEERDNNNGNQQYLSSDDDYMLLTTRPIVDPLQLALAQTLCPPPSSRGDESPVDTVDSRLWVDKYVSVTTPTAHDDDDADDDNNNNNDDDTDETTTAMILPDCAVGKKSLEQASQEMIFFVQEWMMERQKANKRMEERQRKLLSKKKKLKKVVKKRRTAEADDMNDDDLWVDSDDEESFQLQSLCLLTGPVGSGKSNLVHAVAACCGCSVLEINTSDKRGAAAIRRTIEEATQSHSSLDMLKKEKKRQASLFMKEELVDSDDDGEEESEGKGSSVTVILIDEVDIMYEEHGDNGFWTALSDLTKRSKCPIFLTANSIPAGAKSCRYTHVDVSLPSPTECVPTIRKILDREGFTMLSNDEKEVDVHLATIAELCNCDLRRIANELQLFAQASNDLSLAEKQTTSISSKEKERQPELASRPRPKITSVNPHQVRSDSYTLLRIKGNNFMYLAGSSGLGNGGYPVDVYIGETQCPHARIMNDETILAVCPPFPPPPTLKPTMTSVGDIRRYIDVHRRCYTAEYLPISIYSSTRTGILSTTADAVSTIALPDGSKAAALEQPCILECHFSTAERIDDPNKKQQSQNSPSSEEEEFEFDAPKVSRPSLECTSRPFVEIDSKKAGKVLKEAIDAWDKEIPLQETETVPDRHSEETLKSLSNHARLASDAAVLEDIGSAGVPFLSGASRGFGFDLTEAFPVSTNEKSKPPTEERLFELGWKDNYYFYGDSDSYVTRPSTARERKLLKQSESSLRGQTFPRIDTAEVSEDDEDSHVLHFDRSEDDMFLPNTAPTPLLSLPSFLLRKANELIDTTLTAVAREHLFDETRIARRENDLDLLHEYVLAQYDYQLRLFARGITRDVDHFLHSAEGADPRLFLDYLPMLRIMSVHEKAAQHVFEVTQATDPELAATSMSNRGRATRRSRKMGRKHYLEKISPAFEWNANKGEVTGREIGARLAESALLFEST